MDAKIQWGAEGQPSLFGRSWLTDKTSGTRENVADDTNNREVADNIGRMKHYSHDEEQEELQKGLTTKLSLKFDPWNIRKKLTVSDLGHQSRLLVNKNSIEIYVFPFMSCDDVNKVKSTKGLPVRVWDTDTETMHQLVLKKWQSSNSYVFIGTWPQYFVRRRHLHEGVTVGMHWDVYYSRFNFGVLNA